MSSTAPPEQHIIVSLLAENPPELINILCRLCQENRCATVNSHLTQHGQFSAFTLEVKGSWDALARLEVALDNLKKRQGVFLTHARSTQEGKKRTELPYIVYVSAYYQPDILAELCEFFANHAVNVDTINYNSYVAPQTEATMLNATLNVTLPADTQISWLRDQFLDFADSLNLDALIEPWRPQTL